jgi:integrase
LFKLYGSALLSLFYETGARIGEMGSMRIKDVSFDEYGAIQREECM